MNTVGVVTGAGRGMGLACARRVASQVGVLVLVDRDTATLQAAAEELSAAPGARVESVVLDVTDRNGLAGLADRVAALGTLRAVAHVAGVSPTMADWRRIFEVDLVGTALVAETLRPLVGEGTASVYFASMAPTLARLSAEPDFEATLADPLAPGFVDRVAEALGPAVENTGVAYAWAKYGVRIFARREAVRVGPRGARACSVSPGMIDTPQGRQESEQHASMQALAERTPLGRIGRADDLAAVVAFVLSDDAAFLTGVDLLVDGGICAAMNLDTAAS